MKLISRLLPAAVALLFSASVSGEPGKGKGPGHGRMPDDFRGVIHELFANHDAFTRTVELTKDGYRAKTVSKDSDLAAILQKHVAQMESRLDDGMGVRQWDPAFAEMRQHYGDMKIKIEKIKGGISVAVSGTTPEAVAVARNHAKIISGFIEMGSEQMHAEHPAVLTDTETEAGSAPACASCGKAGCRSSGKGKCNRVDGSRGNVQKSGCTCEVGESKENNPSK